MAWSPPAVDSVVCPNGFSAASAFDEKQYIREMKARRRELRAALPPPPDDLKTRYRLVAVDGLPQISPDEVGVETARRDVVQILEDGRVTLHHLAMYLKVRLGLPLQSDFVFYAEMPQWAAERGVRRRWVVGESDQTLPHMRTEVRLQTRPRHHAQALHHSHETLTVYYGAQEPLEDHEEGPGPEERPEAAS
ncbi:long-chain-fatty-acid-CoA ligase [Babesia caballi]|uniref:Long-chain-fatty-acid-CoA ligase n=1 Tax=Babesia caballi TaxID=5871 RepID=A0AAV4LMQ3_BABCB|nr:long-chain-fatty-acid-CoA ligase [Babesia caballi]